MTDRIDVPEQAAESANTLLAGLRRVLMASIGAMALSQEQIEDFVGKLVERGEIADSDARRLLNDVVERRVKMVQDSTKRAEGEFDKRVENLLARMNIPSKTELDTLSEKIGELSRKVDELVAGGRR
ncbi:phasin family protein [Promineifilum sp.]|uniref:phasin family protein n=1 Tax=Promineifilum sp. TaxID=2664178 RepID=UPI0035B40142